MRPGDSIRLRKRRDSTYGTVVRVEDDAVVVDVDGETHRWLIRGCVAVERKQKPHGGVSLSARQLEALRLLDEGRTTREVAELFGVSVHAVHGWRGHARAAAQDAQHRAALGLE